MSILKRGADWSLDVGRVSARLPYVELHCHSYFSLLDGASSPESLVARAHALGYPALALTDHDGLYGAVRFWQAARERDIKPVFGGEVCLDDGGHLTLLAETQAGYANLCRLISAGQLAGEKGHPLLTFETLAAHAGGLLCLSGCRQGTVARALRVLDQQRAQHAAGQLSEAFPGRFWIELQRHYLPSDVHLVASSLDLARGLGVSVVATNDVHYALRADRGPHSPHGGQRLHDLLTSIRHLVTLPEALDSGLLFPNSERYLKAPCEMEALFYDLPEALRSAAHIAERCDVRLDFTAQRLPAFPVPADHDANSYLGALCEAALPRRFDPITPRARAQLAHELSVIKRVGLADYFLVVWDIVRFAREQGIRCQGRGSAANSLVAYLLGITHVDPLQHNLLFERFLSEGTHTTPDIDVDFDAGRREEVIQYVYERYGEAHVGMVCNVVTYRARSALRDAAKALAFPPDVIDRAAKALDTHSTHAAADAIEAALSQGHSPSGGSERDQQGDSAAPQGDAPGEKDLPWHTLAALLREMEGVPRHLSIHVGGMLITAAPLVEIVPLERATMPDRVVVQWNKDSVEDAGLYKIDLLSLRTLGMVEEALRHVREAAGVDLDLDGLPLDDPAIYAMLQRADTVGCFQVESRAQAQMLPRLRPTCFEDLIVEIALVRPGPIQGNMVRPYLDRRQGLEPVQYVHPSLEPVLGETLGVMIFQEQVIRVAQAIAGFSPGEADQLRRAMSRSRSQEAMAALRERFLSGALANGLHRETAAAVFEQLQAFSGYGFCKSHAAAFALVAYQTLYLKLYHPVALTCALLNHQPMGFYRPDVVIGDAQRHGVTVLRPDVNLSRDECTLEDRGEPRAAVRLGLRYVHGLGEAWRERIVTRRGDRPFRDLRDFCRRTRLPRPVVENLIRAGTMDGWGRARRDLLWDLGALKHLGEGLDLQVPIEPVDLPDLGRLERLLWEYELLGLAPDDHVMGLYREKLRACGVSSSGELAAKRPGERVRVAGLVVVRQRPPTAKGHVFFTLEDEEGLINLIVRPQVYERYRDAMRNAPLLLVEGAWQREGQGSVLVYRASKLFRA